MAKKEKAVNYHKRRGGKVYTVLAAVLIAASMVAACTVFFRVESVTMEGNERYSSEEILSHASIEMGANMILTPSQQIAQAIESALPYVDQVQVQKRFPTTVHLVVTEAKPAAVLTGAASAWLIDAKGKLLEPADETMIKEYPPVTGLELLEPSQGAQAQTTMENQKKLDGLVAFTTALQECGLMEGTTSIDVSSNTEILMVYDGRLTVKILNNVDFDRKLKALRQVIAMAGDDGRGIINMKGSDNIIWSKEN